jgi:hypothetical protein
MAPPDLTEYLRAMGGIGQAAQADNPFRPLEDTSNTINQGLYGIASRHGTKGAGEALVAGLLSGLVGGVGDNLGRQFVGNQEDLATQAFRDMNSGKAISREGLSPSVFSRVQQLGVAQQMADAAQAEAMRAKAEDRANQLQDAITLKAAPSATDMRDHYSPEFLAQHNIPTDAPNDEVRARLQEEVKNRIPPKALDDIEHGTSLVKQLQGLSPLIDEMSNNNLGRVIKSRSLDTPEGEYQNRLKSLSDELAKQFAGRTSWPSIEQQLSSLTVNQLGSKEALKKVVANLTGLLQGSIEDKVGIYGQAGYDALEKAKTKAEKKNDTDLSKYTPAQLEYMKAKGML